MLPHPERENLRDTGMVRDEEIERIAIQQAMRFERSRGWQVTSVENENRGFDLISRRPHPDDPQTALEVRFIEVKGRSGVGEVSLSANEYKTAERLKEDYWLYVVYDCATRPKVYPVRDPVRLGWQPITIIEHYMTTSEKIMNAFEG